MKSDLTVRLAARLSALRAARGWTLDQLASASGVSRAALSRLENAEVSPSADVLHRLAAAHEMTLSRLMSMMEDGFATHVRREEQAQWKDETTGFTRRVVSPSTAALAGEVMECKIAPATNWVQEKPDVPGQEHHLMMLTGHMHVAADGESYSLRPGDTLRYRDHGGTRFMTVKGQGAKFMLCRISG